MSEIGISIITPTCREECGENLIQNFLRQKYEHKELIVIINNNEISPDYLAKYRIPKDKLRVYKMDESKSLADCLNFAIEQARYPYVARFDDDDYYAPLYLQEVNDTFIARKCEVVNKSSIYTYFKDEHILIQRYASRENKDQCLSGGAILSIKKEIHKYVQFEPMPWGEDTVFLRKCRELGYHICSSSKNNFVCMRAADLSKHTFRTEMRKYIAMRDTKVIADNISLEQVYQFISEGNDNE